MAGIVKVGFPGTPIVIPHMKAGRLKALAVTTAQRSPHMPDVPTLAEAGVPGYEAIVWVGLLAPAGTPPEIITKLNGEIGKLLRAPEVQQLLASSGVDPTPTTPEGFGAYLKSEFEKWGKVVRDSGATVN
jgi:tripartite-type tricarboxylate transporter receptor subunit TctC